MATLSVEADQLRLICVELKGVAVRFEGAVGGCVSCPEVPCPEPPMGVFMSDWIWAWLRATLYTRTSSIVPANHCPKSPSPPIWSGLEEVAMLPVRGALDTCVPF